MSKSVTVAVTLLTVVGILLLVYSFTIKPSTSPNGLDEYSMETWYFATASYRIVAESGEGILAIDAVLVLTPQATRLKSLSGPFATSTATKLICMVSLLAGFGFSSLLMILPEVERPFPDPAFLGGVFAGLTSLAAGPTFANGIYYGLLVGASLAVGMAGIYLVKGFGWMVGITSFLIFAYESAQFFYRWCRFGLFIAIPMHVSSFPIAYPWTVTVLSLWLTQELEPLQLWRVPLVSNMTVWIVSAFLLFWQTLRPSRICESIGRVHESRP